MKLNVDCIRDLLLCIEANADFGKVLPFGELQDYMPDYSREDIAYTALKLEEAGFLVCSTKNVRVDPEMLLVQELTYAGHQFLEDVRSDDNWSRVKTVSSKVGSSSLNVLSQIATSVLTSLVQSQL